jgi:hypothetical protein
VNAVTHLAHVTQPMHPHSHRVWVLPDSPLGRWTASLAAGGVLLVVLTTCLATVAVDGPWAFYLLGLTLWALMLAAAAAVVAAVTLVRDHALALAGVVLLGVVAAVAVVLELSA